MRVSNLNGGCVLWISITLKGEKIMKLRLVDFGRLSALLLAGALYSATPAAAGGCGWGCGAAPVVVQPYVYQSCSCCSCGGGYAYGYPYAYGAYGAYGAYAADYDAYGVGPGFYRPRYYPRWRYW